MASHWNRKGQSNDRHCCYHRKRNTTRSAAPALRGKCDYQNRRADYVNAVLDKLIDWGFADHNLGLSLAAPQLAEQA
jgi:hypothetical protein